MALLARLFGPLAVFAALLSQCRGLNEVRERRPWQFGDSPLPGPGEEQTVPEAFGVNIHFHTKPPDGEMDMLAASGVAWIRMDFNWGATERKKGVYNFTDYDLLTASLRARHLGAIYILDYTNELYDDNLSPHTDEGRAAFAAWALAGANHFKGDKILWEMYNEPNIGFWKPKPNVQDYVKLALAVGEVHSIGRAFPDITNCLLKYYSTR